MANEKRLIPCGEKATLDELLPGKIFAFGDDCIAVKSEYRCNNGLIEAFIIDSGEQFWGGAKTAKEQNELVVQPLEIVDVDAVEVVHARWIPVTERLPEPFTTVIVCRPGMDEPIVEQGRRTGDGWWKVYGTRTRAVTHWMPMPMAPDNDGKPSFLDKLRRMSDEELVQMFLHTELCDRIPFCKNLETCDPDVEGSITDEKCAVCLLEYLQRPAREFEMFKEE